MRVAAIALGTLITLQVSAIAQEKPTPPDSETAQTVREKIMESTGDAGKEIVKQSKQNESDWDRWDREKPGGSDSKK